MTKAEAPAQTNASKASVLEPEPEAVDRREGRLIYYALNPDVIEEIDGFVSSLKTQSRRSKSSKCCE